MKFFPRLPAISCFPASSIANAFQCFQCFLVFWLFSICCDRFVLDVWQSLGSHLTIDYAQSLFFSWSVDQNARDKQITTSVTEGARRTHENKIFLSGCRPRFSRLAARLRACPPSLNLKKKRDYSQSILLWLRLYGETLSPEKGTTLPAESTFSERFYEKRGRPLCPSQELTTALAHALII